VVAEIEGERKESSKGLAKKRGQIFRERNISTKNVNAAERLGRSPTATVAFQERNQGIRSKEIRAPYIALHPVEERQTRTREEQKDSLWKSLLLPKQLKIAR